MASSGSEPLAVASLPGASRRRGRKSQPEGGPAGVEDVEGLGERERDDERGLDEANEEGGLKVLCVASQPQDEGDT